MNPLPTPSLALEQRIWRYMDLTRFVLLLTRQALYFPCMAELDDPYEGLMPKSHAQAWSEAIEERFLRPLKDLRPHFETRSGGHAAVLDALISDAREKVSYREIRNHFAVSCWHANNVESEAMWKIYSALGSGVAIESTVGRLRDVLSDRPGVSIGEVRYEDFDAAPIERGRSAYYLFSKRPCFEHEHEIRATCKLEIPGKGVEFRCDLGALVAGVHVSPTAPPIFLRSIEDLCSGLIHSLRLPVFSSRLLAAPAYDLDYGLAQGRKKPL